MSIENFKKLSIEEKLKFVNSTDYSRLSNVDKLIFVKETLSFLFNEKKGKLATVKYNGTNKTVPYNVLGIYRDLCEREKSLIKRVGNIELNTIKDNVNKDITVVSDNKSVVDNNKGIALENVSLDKLSIDEQIKIVKSKIFAIFNLSNDKKHKDTFMTSYKGERKYVPIKLRKEYSDLIKLLEKLGREKREAKLIEEDIKKIEEIEDEDFTLVWQKAFKDRDEKNKKKQDNSYVKDIVPFNDNNKKTVEKIEKKYNQIDKKVTGKTNENEQEKKVEKSPKKGKKGFGAFLLGIPFVKKIHDKIEENKKQDEETKKKKRRNFWAAFTAITLAGVTIVGGVLALAGKKKNKPDNPKKNIEIVEEEIPSVCEPTIEDEIVLPTPDRTSVEKPILTDREKQMKIDYYNNNDFENPDREEKTDNDESLSNNITNGINYNGISLGDTVYINENSNIYSNSYDAAGTTNGLHPMFDGSMAREVNGIVYNLNDNIYTLYATDSYAKEKEIDLINQGATKEAVLVTRSDLTYTGQYEGYYNINDVNNTDTSVKEEDNSVYVVKPNTAKVRTRNIFTK